MHNIEQEVENMEHESVQLEAQLEGDGDLEGAKMSDKEDIAGNSSWYGRTIAPVSAAGRTVQCDESAVERGGMSDVVTRAETEDLPELSANTVRICESMMLQRDTAVGQCVRENASVLKDNDGRLVSADSETKETSGDLSRATDLLQGITYLVRDHGYSTSAISESDISRLLVNKNCSQLGDAGDIVLVPDSLERTPPACNVANDANSSLSCDDMVIPDSEADLFASSDNGDIDDDALLRHPDDSKHVNVSVDVSSGDVRDGRFEKAGGCTQLVNMSDGHKSEMTQRNIVDAASSLHQQLRATTSDVCEQLPNAKRPHWTFVVSGISKAKDQVISSIDVLCFY